MCDLCTRNKKVFTHEHELFTFGELRKHEKFGDDNPGAIDQSGFKGHPECGFCRKRFYGDDELYTHCREEHEKCHICDRRNNGRHPQYYLNYQMLEKHFQEAHFVCLDAECQANKTNVFESEMDLKAHQLTEHPNGFSKDARRDARLVDISGFDYRAPYQPERRGGREGRGVGRGRDPNAEPLPTSSAQPIGRAELAYQRQMAIQNSQTASARNFGGQLTRMAPAAAPVSAPLHQNQTLPAIDSLELNSPTPRAAQTSQDQARQLRHAAVMERASNLLKNEQSKISIFRTHVSSYRSSTMTATELIDAFFSLFDVPSTELGKLIRELAEIYENESKRTGLLEAWNSWRAINEDYPSLPGPAGILPGLSSNTKSNGTATSGRRVLRLKSSTAQSSRSAVSRQGSWGNALAAGAPSNPFPALGGASGLANRQKKTPWAGGVSPASRVSPANSRPSSQPPTTTGARASEEMFPSLPTTAKPSTLMAGLTKGSVRWDDRRSNPQPGANPWANGGISPTPAQATTTVPGPIVDAVEGESTAAKKKGKKGKGQVLYHFG
jgi:E3 ubiquitin-protein ligase ZNF598